MAETLYDFELGAADGATGTAANTGFNLLAPNSPGTIKLVSDSISGSRAAEFSVGTVAACVADFNSTGTPGILFTPHAIQSFLFFVKLPSSAILTEPTFFQLYGGSAGATVIMRMALQTNGLIKFTDIAQAHTVTVLTSAVAYYGTWVAIRAKVNTGTTNANGSMQTRFYASPSDAIGDYVQESTAATNLNLGSDSGSAYSVSRIRLGFSVAQASTRVLIYDYVKVDSNSTAWLTGPAAAAAPVVALASSQQYCAKGTTVNLSTTGSTWTGSPTYATTIVEVPPGTATPSITGSTTASPSFVAANAGRYRVKTTITATGGSTDQFLWIYVYPPSGESVKPYALFSATTWSNEGTPAAISLLAGIINLGLTDWAQTVSDPSGQPLPVVMGPFGPGPVWVKSTGKKTNPLQNINRTVSFYKADNTTLVYSTTFALTDDPVTTLVQVDSTGLAAIPALSDRAALVVRHADSVV